METRNLHKVKTHDVLEELDEVVQSMTQNLHKVKTHDVLEEPDEFVQSMTQNMHQDQPGDKRIVAIVQR